MYIPKKYGQSKASLCPFCKKDATTKNSQQVPVCQAHKENILQDLTCFCGDYLELKDGKFGIYFNCTNCGNINIKKALVMNPELGKEPKTLSNKSEKGLEKLKTFQKEEKTVSQTKPTEKKENKKKEKKEITITSDDVDIYYS